MIDETLLSSQESLGSIQKSAPDENPTSSPLLSSRQSNGKRKQPPTVTPKRFTRFFTPRSSLGQGTKISASRQALRDITASGANCKGTVRRTTSTKGSIQIYNEEGTESLDISRKRIKKEPVSPDTTPDRSSPLKRLRKQSLSSSNDDGTDIEYSASDGDFSDSDLGGNTRNNRTRLHFVEPIAYSRQRGPLGRLLRKETGDTNQRYPTVDHGSSDWQNETANFMTRPEDTHACLNPNDAQEATIPFCATSCNTNSLVAIGDEDGGVRLLETKKDGKPGFSKAYLTFSPHANAILDLAFSPDDLLLATASGDQTGKVIDMPTQRVIYTMAGHVSSLKQTRFQPGSASVIATCSRDGSVQIWDLRCKAFDAPVQKLYSSLDGESAPRLQTHPDLKYARSTNTIFDAHATRQPLPAMPQANPKLPSTSSDAPSKTESPSRRGDVSITAVSFLPAERSYLLLTASEANATVKLWDLRTTHNLRSGRRATPLSSTRQPESHSRHRHFGLTSLALSTDGARLYTLCRDNTIYTYSTSHLILGSAPELSLSASSSRPRRSGGGTEKQGLGPIYGFRHPKFHATTFYVKAAIRPASGANTELLAVGSSDGCALLFPTDERYMRRHSPSRSASSPPATRNASRLNDTIPIYTHGAALVRGHSREVTGLTWMPGGELVSVGDDFRARCWREDAQAARGLRVGGEGEGRRWGRGWAEVDGGWDEDED